THFMRSYSRLAIKTCHRRGISAMGGMSALIPIKNDSDANEKAMAQVREDKEREASDGHDGTWVAHPGLVPVAMKFSTASCRLQTRSASNWTISIQRLKTCWYRLWERLRSQESIRM